MYQNGMMSGRTSLQPSSDDKSFIGFDKMSIMYYCYEQDMKQYNETLEAEK